MTYDMAFRHTLTHDTVNRLQGDAAPTQHGVEGRQDTLDTPTFLDVSTNKFVHFSWELIPITDVMKHALFLLKISFIYIF